MALRKNIGTEGQGWGIVYMKTEIIAEVGECFNGDFNTALKMIHIASECGCDTVKFQLLDMDEVALEDPEYEWFSKLELLPEKITCLIEEAKRAGIGILFTPVSVKTAEWLYNAGQTKVKIASSFIKKDELLKYIASHFETIYASTGMASLDDINQLLLYLDGIDNIRLLHCISEYPTGPLLEKRGLKALSESDVHLEMMDILKDIYKDCPVGYSDHTDGIFVPVIAAAMGAEIIEKHFTLDRKMPIEHFQKGLEYMGTDHVLSIEPEQMKKMVEDIRRVERIQGNRRWGRSEGEKILMEFLHGRYQQR